MGIPIPMGFPWEFPFPWDSHGNGSSFGLLMEMGIGIGIVLMGMRIAYFIGEKSNSHPYSSIYHHTKRGTFKLKYVTQQLLIYFL